VGALAGLLGELGDVLTVEPQVDKLSLFDDFLLAVVPPNAGPARPVLLGCDDRRPSRPGWGSPGPLAAGYGTFAPAA